MLRQFDETTKDGAEGERIFADMLTRLRIKFEQSQQKRDDKHRAVADFTLHLKSPHDASSTRTMHADVKFHAAWHLLASEQIWQAGIGSELLHSYASRAAEANAQCLIFMIKRGLQSFRRDDATPYQKLSPAGVWYAEASQLLHHGFSRRIPNEQSVACCSFRACDGGLWHPFAPYDERRRMIITCEDEAPAVWHGFWSRERSTDLVWP